MEHCPCHKFETSCPDASSSGYHPERKVIRSAFRPLSADVTRGQYVSHPFASGGRKPNASRASLTRLPGKAEFTAPETA